MSDSTCNSQTFYWMISLIYVLSLIYGKVVTKVIIIHYTLVAARILEVEQLFHSLASFGMSPRLNLMSLLDSTLFLSLRKLQQLPRSLAVITPLASAQYLPSTRKL